MAFCEASTDSSIPNRVASSSMSSVRTAPSARQFTRTPPGVQATANDAVRLLTPALAAPYGARRGIGRMPAPEEMFTIEPLACSSIGFAAARDINQTVERLA